MTEILYDALTGNAVSLGSVKDRSFLETKKTELMKYNTLGSLRKDLYEMMATTGDPVLDDTEHDMWKFRPSSTPSFHLRDWSMEVPKYWKLISNLNKMHNLPVIIADIHDLAGVRHHIRMNTQLEPVRSCAGDRLQQLSYHRDISVILQALKWRVASLKTKLL